MKQDVFVLPYLKNSETLWYVAIFADQWIARWSFSSAMPFGFENLF
jgi:hypothetical protein